MAITHMLKTSTSWFKVLLHEIELPLIMVIGSVFAISLIEYIGLPNCVHYRVLMKIDYVL